MQPNARLALDDTAAHAHARGIAHGLPVPSASRSACGHADMPGETAALMRALGNASESVFRLAGETLAAAGRLEDAHLRAVRESLEAQQAIAEELIGRLLGFPAARA